MPLPASPPHPPLENQEDNRTVDSHRGERVEMLVCPPEKGWPYPTTLSWENEQVPGAAPFSSFYAGYAR
eukprot:9700422-Heterocapsa_arctica.AAC.1